MGKCKNTTEGGGGMQNGASPTPSSHWGEQGDTGNTAKDIIGSSIDGGGVLTERHSFQDTLQITQLSRLPYKWSPSPEYHWDHSTTPDNQMYYCIHVRVTFGEGRGDQPPPSHAQNRSLIADILQETCPRDCITEAVVLALGEAILFFRRCSHNEGLLYCDTQDIEHCLMGSITWAGRIAQVEVTVNNIQKGHRAIADAILEKETMARWPGHLWGLRGAAQSQAATCNINDWVCGLNKGASDGEVRKAGDVHFHGYEQGGTHAQHINGGGKWCRQQRTLWVPRSSSIGSPSSGGSSSGWGSDQSSLHLAMMRTSWVINRSAHARRGIQVKVNLPIF